MKKSALSLLLASCMALSLLPMTALAVGITVTEVVPPQYDEVRNFSEGLAAVKLDGKWGYIDKTGKVVVPCKYDAVWPFQEGRGEVRIGEEEGGKYGFVDGSGQEVIPCQYDDAYDFECGMAAVCVNEDQTDKWGFIDTNGKEIVPCGKYENLMLGFSEGMASVDIGGKWGFIDTTGKEVIPGLYDWAENFREGLAVVVRDDKWGYIDQTGKEVIPCQFSGQALWFSEGLAAVGVGEAYEDGTYGYIDRTGKVVVPCEYDGSWDFHEGMVKLYRGGKNGFANAEGKEVAPCQYDGANDFSEGLAAVMRNGKCGYIDKTGKEVIPLQYEAADDFSQGLAAVMRNGKCGYIDQTGKEVIPLQYDGAWTFYEGYAICLRGNQFIFVDRDGNEAACPYNYVEDLCEGLAAVCVGDPEGDGKWGFISVTEIPVTKPTVPVKGTAYPSTQTVEVDGKAVEFQCYALKDAAGNDTNYIKLRDLADILNGSAAQFDVGWNGQVTITSKTAYTPTGTERNTPFSGQREYQAVTGQTLVDGEAKDLAAFTLTDDNGGGYTYYKLRDLGDALGITVDWSAQRGIYIETK